VVRTSAVPHDGYIRITLVLTPPPSSSRATPLHVRSTHVVPAARFAHDVRFAHDGDSAWGGCLQALALVQVAVEAQQSGELYHTGPDLAVPLPWT
jgi:hypothetical protein